MYYRYCILILLSVLFSHKIDDIEIELYQPDGSSFQCYASGDQYYNWVHDQDGYSIIQSSNDGYYYYATKVNGSIVPSSYIVGSVNPEDVGLTKNIIINREEYLTKRNLYWDNIERRDAPSIGTINNINVFIRFSDEQEFPNSRNFYDIPFNQEEGPSMGHYFHEVSYELLTVNTVHFPITEDLSVNVSYQDQYPRSYYQPYNEVTNPNGYQNDNQSRVREHNLLKNAIEYIASEVPEDLDVDSNNDGYVDNVTFLVRGSPGAWASLLWPHRWVLYTHNVYLNGSRVYDYNLNMEQGGYFTVGTLCHEFFHSLGAPDLYHYWDDTAPVAVGGWDVMDQSSNTPQSMSAYMKYKYTDWITELPIANSGGTYQISPLSNPEGNIIRINSPSSETEYFVAEYRVREGIYEVNTPSGEDGMIIYRVNSQYNGNANGPPDELYVYRTGGTLNSNGTFSGAVFNAESNRDKFNDNTDPSCFLTDGSPGGINISNISNAEDVIRFDLVNMILLPELLGVSYDSDDDGEINPGEEILIDLSINNLTDIDAQNVVLTINPLDDSIQIINNEILFDNVDSYSNSNSSVVMNISDDAFGSIPFNVIVTSEYIENGQELTYNDEFTFNIEVTLNQNGFPFMTTNEIHSSPIVCDLDNNGQNEIIFGDHFGEIRAIDELGNEVLEDIFPIDTGGQIWGSPVVGDIDLDNNIDIAFVSKSGNVYVFDYAGLKWFYETENRLIGTPSIVNVDNSNGMELIVPGYGNNQDNLYIFSSEGDLIDQLEVFEKIKSGFAFTDINNNGYDDFVFGTDDNNLYLVYDGNEIAEGFPFNAEDKFQLKPTIINNSGEFLIIAPCKNSNIYILDQYGTLTANIIFDSNISTSVSILEYNNNVNMFAGLNNGDVVYFDTQGNFEVFSNVGSKVIGEIVFSDLNNDTIPEIIVVNSIGEIHVFSINGSYYNHFPISNEYAFSSSPLVLDVDSDNDLELIAGTTNSIISIDIKEEGLVENYWNIYGNNFTRNSFHNYETTCVLGDLDFNGYINVLDVVNMINVIIENEFSEELLCLCDFNDDGMINIQDIILLIDYIFNEAN